MSFTRLWDYRLLPYLPDLQFKGQLREIVLIMHDWRDIGKSKISQEEWDKVLRGYKNITGEDYEI